MSQARPSTPERPVSFERPSAVDLDARTDRRSARLYETDAQFRATAPLDAVTEAIRRPGLPLAALVATVMKGYADRPALGERATELVTDPRTGRTAPRLLERLDTLTYRELRERVGAVAAEWRRHPGHPVGAGDLVAVLGSTSAEYAVVELACIRSGAVSVPLQAGAPALQLAPVVEQTGPRLLVVDVDHLEVAVELAEGAPSPGRIIVIGHRPAGRGRPPPVGRQRLRPPSAELTAFVEDCLQVRLRDGYGSTEAGTVALDGRLLRPPVTDHKLVDVPELGYVGTDSPYPRGELLIRSDRLVPGYFRRPDATAEAFDEDGSPGC
ncbi:AMP-binding protein [Kitasatospora sp. NPDC094011]|uniref:AMP-binding protein n=1 Tax=Kitasatospora sp. NPDC094011 TaxID=3364090 RepID=UPI0038218F56